MTIAPARKGQEVAVSSLRLPGLQRDALPTALTEARPVDGFKNPQWTARALVPAEKATVAQVLAELDARFAPVPDARAIYHIARLLAHWNPRAGVDQESVIDDWADDLSGFSEAHIAEACELWRQNNKYKPTIAELRQIASSIESHDRTMQHRARVLLGLKDPRPWERLPTSEKSEPLSPARREELLTNLSKTDPVLAASARALLAANTETNATADRERRRTNQRRG